MGKKYNPCEIEKMLKSLAVLVDTREQDTARARERYLQFGVPFQRKALKFGDYSAELKGLDGEIINLESVVCVERKMSIDELCGCFCQSRERFRREFERALDAGAHVYLLVENGTLNDVYHSRYRSRMNANALAASILAWSIEFSIVPLFISADISGKLIHDILYREARWYLENLDGDSDG